MGDRIPRWIVQRCEHAELRCINPFEAGYLRGRIQFKFKTPRDMAEYLVELGLSESTKHMRAERIDKDGHFEPGNLELRDHYHPQRG